MVGFDADLARKVFSNLGYTVKFQEMDWNTKIVTLKAGTIDVIWNGMTVTDELKENILLSDVYLENRQYGVVKASEAENYTSAANLAGKTVAYESGSAAEGLVKDIECTKNGINTQNAAVMEVAGKQKRRCRRRLSSGRYADKRRLGLFRKTRRRGSRLCGGRIRHRFP